MSDAPLTYKGSVYPWHCDQVGHMNVMYYVGKFDEATWNFFALLGMTRAFFRDQGRGMAALEQNIRYKRELLPGDTMEVRTRLTRIEGKKVHFSHSMVNCQTGEVAAECDLFAVHVDTALRKSCPFPDEVVATGRRLMAEAGGGALV
ncbi:MAG: acyl-CoA thioesterase [Hyphomicrobiales bacterium]|nr:acyl-CoA thioesterase [Hyphomicrobiales bacterium]MCP5373910.1 acyl-CoA thioesterase [Hyphomicrobiales bacterium]